MKVVIDAVILALLLGMCLCLALLIIEVNKDHETARGSYGRVPDIVLTDDFEIRFVASTEEVK